VKAVFAHIHSWREREVQVLDIQDSPEDDRAPLVWMAAAPLLPSLAAVQPRVPADAETATRRPSLITNKLEEVDGYRASVLKPPGPRLLELPRPDGRPCRLCYDISAMAGKLQSIREIVDEVTSEPDRAQKWFEQKLAELSQASLKRIPRKGAQSVKSEKPTKKRAGK
jgi:hypothetical protein